MNNPLKYIVVPIVIVLLLFILSTKPVEKQVRKIVQTTPILQKAVNWQVEPLRRIMGR